MSDPRSTEPRSPSVSTIGRVIDLADDQPQPRRHHDSEMLRRAVDDRLRARWATVLRRGLGWVLSAGMGSGATAGGFMLTEDPQPQTLDVPGVCEPDLEQRRDIRLALDYLAAIFGMLREPDSRPHNGREPLPDQPLHEPLPEPRFTNGTP